MNKDYLQTPIGTLEISATDLGISRVDFISDSSTQNENPNKLTHQCKQQLKQYFDGNRKEFDLALDQSGTDFQKSVWASLQEIPFGKTLAYRDIALMINNPKAVRAVGAANGKNPIAIIVPCHRVIGNNKTLTGYAGGLERKAWLLKHEGIVFKN